MNICATLGLPRADQSLTTPKIPGAASQTYPPPSWGDVPFLRTPPPPPTPHPPAKNLDPHPSRLFLPGPKKSIKGGLTLILSCLEVNLVISLLTKSLKMKSVNHPPGQ